MSLAIERKLTALEKKNKALEAKIESVIDAFQKELDKVKTDKQMITEILYRTMENYLSEKVEFSLSVDGKIKEILNP
tara:strand:+ start:79640 stop:79870 length:231 start_codon:yes stop_codon:yes gene_type:complete